MKKLLIAVTLLITASVASSAGRLPTREEVYSMCLGIGKISMASFDLSQNGVSYTDTLVMIGLDKAEDGYVRDLAIAAILAGHSAPNRTYAFIDGRRLCVEEMRDRPLK